MSIINIYILAINSLIWCKGEVEIAHFNSFPCHLRICLFSVMALNVIKAKSPLW